MSGWLIGNPPFRMVSLPAPRPYEGIAGWFLRAAESNGYDHLSWVLNRYSVKPDDLFGIADGESISELLCASAATRDRSSCSGKNRQVAYTGDWARRRFLRSDLDRICPLCIREDPYSRAAWQFRALPVCGDHGAELIDRCPKCDRELRRHRTTVCRCAECGFDLRYAQSRTAEPALIELARAVQRAAYTRRETQVDPLPIGNPVWRLSLDKLLDTIEFFGSYGLGDGNRGLSPALAAMSVSKTLLITSAAAVVLVNWPYGFWHLIDNMRGARNPGSSGCSREFSNFYSALRRHFKSGETAFIFTAFRDYLVGKGGYGYAANWLGIKGAPPRADIVSRPAAARILGVSPETVNVLHKEGEIEAISHPLSNSPREAYFTRRSVFAYRRRRRDIIQSEAAARLLGVSRRTYRQLVDGGLLRPADRVTYRPRKAYEVRKTCVLDLLDKLRNLTSEYVGQRAVRYDKAAALAGNVGLCLADLLRAASEGNIAIYGVGGVGIRGLLFDRDDLERMVERSRQALPIDETVRDITDQLKINSSATCRLLRGGVIRPGASNADPLGLVRFHQQYVSAAQLAQQRRLAPRLIVDYLGRRDIHPVLGRTVDLSAAIYDRRRLPAEMAAAENTFDLGCNVAASKGSM